MRYSQRMFDLKSKLHLIAIGGAAVLVAAIVFVILSQRSTISDLRTKLAQESAAHDTTRASLATARVEIDRQNNEIAAQRANVEAARRDLAAAVDASAGSQDIIDRLLSSSRSPAAGKCEASAATKGAWK